MSGFSLAHTVVEPPRSAYDTSGQGEVVYHVQIHRGLFNDRVGGNNAYLAQGNTQQGCWGWLGFPHPLLTP